MSRNFKYVSRAGLKVSTFHEASSQFPAVQGLQRNSQSQGLLSRRLERCSGGGGESSANGSIHSIWEFFRSTGIIPGKSLERLRSREHLAL